MQDRDTNDPGGDVRWADVSHYANHSERGRVMWDHRDDMSLSDYWLAVAETWQDCDRCSLGPSEWRQMWGASDPDNIRIQHVMTDDERDELAALPDRVTVYRGIHARNRSAGMSWTLDCDLAHWFALRSTTNDWPGGVITGTVLKLRILALFQGRGESEVVVFPRFVYRRRWAIADQACADRHMEQNRARREAVAR